MDWDNARVFLAIYRNGTLRGAAALLQIDQATAGRRLAALERSLDARLFLRTPAGYVPTAAGELAFAAAERMEQAADQLQRQMQGLDHRLSGVVRMASSEAIGSYFVMDAVKRLHARHPDITISLSTSIKLSNLTRREADLAIRNVRPDSPDLIHRHLARKDTGLYAAPSYLRQRGEPAGHGLRRARAGDLSAVGVAGLVRCLLRRAHRQRPRRHRAELRHDDHRCRAGRAGHRRAARAHGGAPSELVRIWPQRAGSYDLWLVMHGDLNRTARVRAVADAIVEVFEQE